MSAPLGRKKKPAIRSTPDTRGFFKVEEWTANDIRVVEKWPIS
jgi:hypothetical protein